MSTEEGSAIRCSLVAAAAALVVSVVVAASAVVPASPAGAQAVPPQPARIDDTVVDPVLDALPVRTIPATAAADQHFADAQVAEAQAQANLVSAQRDQLELENKATDAAAAVVRAEEALDAAVAELKAQTALLAERKAATKAARAALTREQQTLRALVSTVFTSRPVDSMIVIGTFDQMTEDQRRQDVEGRTVEVQSDIVESRKETWEAAKAAQATQADNVRSAEGDRDDAVAARDDAISVRDDFERLVGEAATTVATRTIALEQAGERRGQAFIDRRDARLLAPVVGVDMTLVDVHAYWIASATAPCAIPWWVLAGIGRVETGHGTAHGSAVEADGTTTKPILGIALDGRPGVAAIADTDAGLLDGDQRWDRAVGPMQFIPGTWAHWGADGNGDDVSNPHNLYDAAAAAANYLCFGRDTLTDEPVITAALMSYNHSVPYGAQVLSAGHGYRDALGLADRPPPDTNTEVASATE